jgi:hypothetical protein
VALAKVSEIGAICGIGGAAGGGPAGDVVGELVQRGVVENDPIAVQADVPPLLGPRAGNADEVRDDRDDLPEFIGGSVELRIRS